MYAVLGSFRGCLDICDIAGGRLFTRCPQAPLTADSTNEQVFNGTTKDLVDTIFNG
jgi:hypothetical protein